MAGWHLSEQARQALRTGRDLARGWRAPGSADPLLVAILEQWDDERAGGPALLRACGLTADEAGRVAGAIVAPHDTGPSGPGAEPRVVGTLRLVLDQAERIAAEAGAPYIGTEHLVVAILWQDNQLGAHELRRHGVGYSEARERLAGPPATEQAEAIDPGHRPPGGAGGADAGRGHAGRAGPPAGRAAPDRGDGRITTLHHLLALLMVPKSGARRLLTELGLDHEEVVQRVEEGARRVAGEAWRPQELPVEGWEEFRVTDRQDKAIRRRFHHVNKQLGPRGVLDRLLGRAS